MSTKLFSSSWKARNFSETQCYAVLLFLLSPVVYCIIQSENISRILFHGLLFSTGFIVFTFLEYIAHRFWMHGKEEKQPGTSLERHMHHHRHPTEIKITTGMRNILLFGNLALIAFSCWLNNYFTLFAGFYSGFVYYCFMHVFLHKTWAKKIFPSLQVSHIHHHCKYPDRCFSTCVTWWDKLFNTSVPGEVKISERVLQFYFGKQGH
jgi:sterol desaturase/sphingolipid hydroxylase (fatty acid hydroxylase superfamily)